MYVYSTACLCSNGSTRYSIVHVHVHVHGVGSYGAQFILLHTSLYAELYCTSAVDSIHCPISGLGYGVHVHVQVVYIHVRVYVYVYI